MGAQSTLLLTDAKEHLSIATKQLEQSQNCVEVINSYFQGRADRNKTRQDMNINISSLIGDEMKNVTLRGDGRFMARVQLNKKTHTVYARTKKQIEMKLRALKRKLKETELLKTKYTLHSWLDFWWEHYKKPFVNEKSNIPIYIASIKQNFPNLKLENYTTAQIQRIMNLLPTSRTKELIMLYLNASFQKAVDTDVIKTNPCKAVVKERKINNKRIAFTFDEQVKIVKAIRNTDIERDIMIYLFTGMRKNEYKPSELLKNLDITNKTLKIESEKKRSSTPVYRLVDLSEAMIDYMLKPNQFKQLTVQYIYLHFKKILKELGIQGGLHTLRHTFATNYYYIGVPDKLRSEWLGHEKVDMTQDIYTNIDRSISREKLIDLYGDLLYKI